MALELIFENWWREDEQRERKVCCALVDVDRFGELNRQFSTRMGDRTLRAIAERFDQLINSECGLHRVFRFSGERFFFFFGDAETAGTVHQIETIRQTIEASILSCAGEQHRVTVRAAVSGARVDDDTERLYRRLDQLLAEARRQGGNCTWVDSGEGPQPVDCESLEVEAGMLTVE